MNPLAIKAFLSKAWPFILAAAVAILMVVIYRAGVNAERSRWEAAEAQKKVRAEQQARRADEALREAEIAKTGEIAANRKEVDDATDLPDQAPTARQRARACLELVRQARATGAAPPAC